MQPPAPTTFLGIFALQMRLWLMLTHALTFIFFQRNWKEWKGRPLNKTFPHKAQLILIFMISFINFCVNLTFIFIKFERLILTNLSLNNSIKNKKDSWERHKIFLFNFYYFFYFNLFFLFINIKFCWPFLLLLNSTN